MDRFMSTISRGLALAAVMAASMLASTPLAAQAAAPVYVVDDDNSTLCAPVYNGSLANPLQDAIDAAIASHVKTIRVCPGTYTGLFTIDAANTLTIKRQDPSWYNVEIRPPAVDDGAIIKVTNSKKVTLDGLYVNGEPFDDTPGGTMEGIGYYSSSGTIQKNVVKDIADPVLSGASGTGIKLFDVDSNNKISSVVVKNNLVARCEGGAIIAIGAVKATITGNQVDGANGDTSNGVPLYGIGLASFGAARVSGSITKNTIYFSQNGIALVNAGKIPITGNRVDGSTDFSLNISTKCETAGLNASKNKVSGNTFFGPGISIKAEADGDSDCNPNAGLNTILNNSFVADQLEAAVAVTIETVLTSGSFTPVANKNKVTGNTAWGFLEMVSLSGSPLPTGTVVSKNKVVHR